MEEKIDFLEELSKFTFTSKYARYQKALKRREVWEESSDRGEQMNLRKFAWLSEEDLKEISWAYSLVKQKYVVPAMRSMQFAGQAIEAHNARGYNCAVRHVDSLRAFSEGFYLLLCGCGVTFGLNKQFLSRLPDLVGAEDKTGTVITYQVDDTIEGWANSLEALLMCYFKNTPFTGRKIVFDYSKIRKKGTLLKTSGGKAPGYKGLKECHKKVKSLLDHIIEIRGQHRLKSIDAYDILMHASDAVLSGGIRRAATAIIFEESDEDMLFAKTLFNVKKIHRHSIDEEENEAEAWITVGDLKYKVSFNLDDSFDKFAYDQLLSEKKISWKYIEPQRGRSNNSIILKRKEITLEKLKKVIDRTRQFGEPGFVFVNDSLSTLYNPCFEVGFIPVTNDGRCGVQFCNLTSINGAKVTTLEEWEKSAKAAAIIGTLQASYTDFPFLSNAAKELTEEESLLGVSITGIMDNPDLFLDYEKQKYVANIVKEVNKQWAKKIGINQAARTTLVKPEGTSSLVLKSASGIHPHHARKYIRRIQCNTEDNVYQFAKSLNPHACEPSVWSANKTDDVISFPVEVGEKAMIKKDLTALEHLEIIKQTQAHWINVGTTEANKKLVNHNCSCTVIVDDSEWDEVIEYVYANKDYFSAISFLSKMGDKSYAQAPLEAIVTPEDEKKFDILKSQWKKMDFTEMKEDSDSTAHREEASCAGGACEIIKF